MWRLKKIIFFMTKLFQVIDMFMALIMVMVSWLYSYLQTQVVYINYVQLFVCQSYLNKVTLKRKAQHLYSSRGQPGSIPLVPLSLHCSPVGPCGTKESLQHSLSNSLRNVSEVSLIRILYDLTIGWAQNLSRKKSTEFTPTS